MSNDLEIFLLGGLKILLNGEPIKVVTSQKAKALFVYLAYRQRPFPRDTLATLLYGDLPQKRATARRLCWQALDLKRELGDQWGMTYSLTYLGRVAEAQRDYPEAQQLFQESLSIYQEMEDKRGIAFAYQNLGDLARAEANNATAIERYQAALALFEEIGNQLGVVACLMHLAEVNGHQNDFQAAQTYLHRALQITATFQAWPKTLDILIQLARLLAQFGEQARALELLTMAQHHLVGNSSAGQQLEATTAKLKAALPSETVAAIQKMEPTTSLEEIIREILDTP